jgi:hypothetical protein
MELFLESADPTIGDGDKVSMKVLYLSYQNGGELTYHVHLCKVNSVSTDQRAYIAIEVAAHMVDDISATLDDMMGVFDQKQVVLDQIQFKDVETLS